MRPEGGDLAFLWDMREQAVRLIKLLEGIDEAMFLSNEDVRLVAERRIEIIGEAASHVSSQLRSQHSEIPWRQIVGQRNILIHAYGEIIPQRVRDAPELLRMLDALISQLEENSP